MPLYLLAPSTQTTHLPTLIHHLHIKKSMLDLPEAAQKHLLQKHLEQQAALDASV